MTRPDSRRGPGSLVRELMHRLDSGRWDAAALSPAAMNAAAAALGPAYNVHPNSSNKLVPVPLAFLRYRPARSCGRTTFLPVREAWLPAPARLAAGPGAEAL
jgi:hypothetical protein